MTDDALDTAADRLYAASPDEFMSLRTDLASQARSAGDAAAAKLIRTLRKPTVSASIVNRLVHDDSPVVDQLLDLGDRMRAAHADLDAGALRELSVERRTMVSDLARRALTLAGQSAPSATVRDEVVATFDAAVADPEIAARLGRLTRAEKWSGFGEVISGSPELTLVRGGRGKSPTRPARKFAAGTSAPGATAAPAQGSSATAEPASSTAARKRAERVADKARSTFDSAERALAEAETSEQNAAGHVQQLTAALADLQADLEVAKREREDSRRALRTARTRRREARSALDRAERQLPE